MKGSGQVRDLSEAISLSSTLGNTVQTYAQQTTRDGQINRLDALIEQWANTSSMKSLKDQAEALAGVGPASPTTVLVRDSYSQHKQYPP